MDPYSILKKMPSNNAKSEIADYRAKQLSSSFSTSESWVGHCEQQDCLHSLCTLR